MIDIQDFIEAYYGDRPTDMFTVEEFDKYKEENGYEERDYPLDEYKHIAESDINCEPVRFSEPYSSFDYRFCEIP